MNSSRFKSHATSFLLKLPFLTLIILGKDAPPRHGAGKNLEHKYRILRRLNPYISKGTYMGVIDFLERFVGVRWYFPGRIGTYVPELKDKNMLANLLLTCTCWREARAREISLNP